MGKGEQLKPNSPFPDANTFPYPRLCVPTLRTPSRYGPITQNCVEYTYYEKECVQIGDKEILVWKEIRNEQR